MNLKEYKTFRAATEQGRSLEGGGLNDQSAVMFNFLSNLQQNQGIKGHLMEIGVWKGHTASLLALLQQEEERLFLSDMNIREPDIQEWRNLMIPGQDKKLQILKGDSGLLRKRNVLQELFGEFRWVHIDGEHSYEGVISDLNLAFDCIGRSGIVACDDIFHPMSACVTQAVFDYVARNSHKARLLVLGFCKAYLTTPYWYDFYHQACYKELLATFDQVELPITLCLNGWNQSSDYYSIIPRRSEGKYVTIGQFHEDIPS